MTKFSNKLQKTCFWPIFGPFSQFLGKKFFSEKSCSVTHNFTWHSSIMPNFRKHLWHNFKKMPQQTEGQNTDGRTERRTEGWKDRQNLFYRNLSATARGPIRTAYFHSTKLMKSLLFSIFINLYFFLT